MRTSRRDGMALFMMLLALALSGRQADAAAAAYTVEAVDGIPKEVSAELGEALASGGHKVTGPDGPLCTVWFVQSVSVTKGFSPTLAVKYPLVPGELIGVLEVAEGTEMTDFREQVLEPGFYTLRYGQQPQDGNHIGTSELRDFLMALPAEEDKAPETPGDLDEIVSLSKDAAGTTHPAILALRPTDKAKPGETELTYESKDDLWILTTSVGAEDPLVLRLVVAGFAVE